MPLPSLTRSLLALPPVYRRGLLITADLLLIPLAVWLSFALRLAHPWPPQLQQGLWVIPVTVAVSLAVYGITGQYKGLTLYSGSRTLYAIALRNGAVVVISALVEKAFALPGLPRVSWLFLWLLLTLFTGATRFILRDLLLLALRPSIRHQLKRVLIYGAGDAGAQLSQAFRFSHSHKIAAFLDDNPKLWGRHLNGVSVYAPKWLPEIIERFDPDEVWLAIPSLSHRRLRQLMEQLQLHGLKVLQVPSLAEIASGYRPIDSLRPITIEDLLGRDPVPPHQYLLETSVRDRSVLVSGAGGSIGSELCRQILQLQPQRIVLLENSESALYTIDQELRQLFRDAGSGRAEIVPLLGSVSDGCLLTRLFSGPPIHTVFHAAAYKHVPLVEVNPLTGLANNVLGTRCLAGASAAAGVERFVLISTDKAVRPTNVMGASKRLAELVVQALAMESAQTRMAIVRFGNVLGSSGSVVPLFRRQIAAGGPITVTDPEIVRYFMTIPEAVELVLQASTLAQGGDLFLLEMGEPIKILDLARQMVALSGLEIRDERCPDGDIEVHYTGLRPGEKLYEELLIDSQSMPTPHPLIYRAIENCIPPLQLWPHLDALQAALNSGDEETVFVILSELVPEWSGTSVWGKGAPKSGVVERALIDQTRF